jgi:hypothetical protein
MFSQDTSIMPLLALSFRRSIQITQNTFDLRTSHPLGYDDLSDEVEQSKVYDADTKRSLITILALVVELCVCLTDCLELTYSSKQVHEWSSQVQLEKFMKIQQCRESLSGWSDKAASKLEAWSDEMEAFNFPGSDGGTVVLFTELTRIYYL